MKTAALKPSVLSTFSRKTLSRNVLSLVLAGCASAGWAVPFDIAANTTATGVRTLVAGETGTVNQGASLSASDKTITWSGASAGTVTINNQGTVRATANGGRAIDTSSSGGAGRSLVLQNGVNGQILGGNDAVRINFSSGVGSVAVDNAGYIYSVTGQALDFNAIQTGTVEIVNQATGVISTKDADGVRPGANGTVINYGKIIGGGAGLVAGASNLSSEAIDFQDFGGTVHNKTGGIINGGRHGITGDGVIDVTNAAGGLIRGHNGSGINLDNTGSVVNHGTISGNFDATLINGDGDGVDIDGVGSIDNYGRIEANGAGGVKNGPTDPNRADGIAMGGGIINNYAGATVYSADRGILIDDSEAGPAFGKTTLVNHGVIDAQTTGVTLQGEWDDYLLNTGTIRSRTGDVAIDMGGGNDTLVVKTGSVVEGSVRGGTGTNQLVLSGSGAGQLGLTQEFGSIQIEGGNWGLGGAQQLNRLQGTGSLAAQSVELRAGSNVIVGNLDGSGGQLNLLSDVKVGGTVALDFWGTGAQDSLAVTGLFDLLDTGRLQLNFAGNDFASGQTFNFLSASRFNALDYSRFAVSGLGSDWQWEFNQFNVANYETVSVKLNRTVASVSEPSSLVLLLVGLLSMFQFARKRKV